MTMQHDPRIPLADIERVAEEIAGFLKGVDYDSYADNLMQQRAVERNFGIIGEALNRLNRISPELVERIPDARKITGFRNKLVHDYDHIATVTVWKAAMNSLPKLLDTVRELLTEMDLA